ncbi:surfeit locus protein 2 isoform X2 [Sphaeramia orbicularis]|uniref:surfeit locus protein 2 isoform X2 n=1 Tax=Sphaeramia orbicularis TaxID=375764 RepID=UPI00117E3E21|nr:surfeit locus protein 2 isoform X2 [Sphaeramia orbicularis]
MAKSVQNEIGQLPVIIKVEDEPQQKTLEDVCRLCDNTFPGKKDKHNLIIGALQVKPAYTLALEELTGAVSCTDDVIAVCSSCRTLLNRYYRSSSEVERIGTLVKSMSTKRCIRSPETDDGHVRKWIVIGNETLARQSVDSTESASPLQECVSQVQLKPQTSAAEDSATPALGSEPRQADVIQTAVLSAVEASSSRPQPQSQHAPQLTASLSGDGAVRRTFVMAPVVWSAQSVQSAVCSLKTKLQSQPPPQPTSPLHDGPVKKKFITIAPALHPPPVQSAPCSQKPRSHPQSQRQLPPQPISPPSHDGPVKKKFVTLAPALHPPGQSVSALQECVSRAQAESQLQPCTSSQPTEPTSVAGDSAASAMSLQPEQNQLDCSHTVTQPGKGPLPSCSPTITEAKSVGDSALTQSANTRGPMAKQSKIVITTPNSVSSRIVTGPLQVVLDNIVKGRINRIPHAIMLVPGLFDVMVQEVLDVLKKECKKLTSLKFGSVLRQTSFKNLKDFKWMDVVAEWQTNAPTFLKFLEAASSISMEATTLKPPRISHGKTNKFKIPMAGAILLNARCLSMSAHMYRNALVMHHCRAKTRFRRLNRLGVCISGNRALAKLKEKFLQWKEKGCEDGKVSNRNCGGADSGGEFTVQLQDTDSDESKDESENRRSPEDGAPVESESDVATPDDSDDEEEVRCTLNGHELPCNLTEIQKFTQGKKYEKLSATAEFNYSQYEPHIVPSTKQPNQLFCKLTLRHLNRQPHHVLKHVNGKRYRKALAKYEECVKQGTEFVPARLKQKKPRNIGEQASERGSSMKKHGSDMWEPTSSEDDHSDSDDSMSDLYPPSMFTLKNSAEKDMEDRDEDGDDFQTDEEEEMETDTQMLPKRKKVRTFVLTFSVGFGFNDDHILMKSNA